MASWFNPTDFATGVLESLDKRIDRNAEEAKVYKEEQRDLAKQSKQAIANRTTLVQQLLSVANKLKAQGVSQAQVKAAHSAGPDALLNLSTQVQTYLAKKGTAKLSPDEVEAMITTSDLTQMTPEVQSMNLRQFLDATSNMPNVNTVTETADERNLLERALGVGQKDAIRVKLDQDMQPGGYSLADLNESATLASYKSIMPGASTTFTAPVDYSSTSASNAYMRFKKDNIDNILKDDPIFMKMVLDGSTPEEELDYRQGKIESFVRSQFSDFGFQVFTDDAANYRTKLGEERYIGLINDLDLSDDEMKILDPMFNGDGETSTIKLMFEKGSSEIVRDSTGTIISVTNFNLAGKETKQYSGENASKFINGMVQSNLLTRDPETGSLTVSGTTPVTPKTFETLADALQTRDTLEAGSEVMINGVLSVLESTSTGGKFFVNKETGEPLTATTTSTPQTSGEPKEKEFLETKVFNFLKDYFGGEGNSKEKFIIKIPQVRGGNTHIRISAETLKMIQDQHPELLEGDDVVVEKSGTPEYDAVNPYDIQRGGGDSEIRKLLETLGGEE